MRVKISIVVCGGYLFCYYISNKKFLSIGVRELCEKSIICGERCRLEVFCETGARPDLNGSTVKWPGGNRIVHRLLPEWVLGATRCGLVSDPIVTSASGVHTDFGPMH
jgi:hypothetical protein